LSSPSSSVQYANVDLSGDSPWSRDFSDRYHSDAGACEESAHVFLLQNDIPNAWAAKDSFTIAELGFGTGLNFLLTWEALRNEPGALSALTYVSFEQFPLRCTDLERIWKLSGSLKPQADELIKKMAEPSVGCESIEFEGGLLTLKLCIGDANVLLPAADFRADAWFLDGFCPRVNPELWNAELMREVALHSHPGTTASTYTVASSVRENLTKAGFEVEKAPGFGRKKELLRATMLE